MTIVFFTTAASHFDASALAQRTYPSRQDVWRRISRRYPEHTFYIVAQPPAPLLLDQSFISGAGEAPAAVSLPGKKPVSYSFAPVADRVFATLLPEAAAPDAFADCILSLEPNLAIAASGWTPPFDWLGLQDSLVADILRENSLPVLCHPSHLSLDAFDKSRTHVLLERYGFPMPRSVYVHHELYWCERGHKELTRNVYKAFVLEQIKRLNYPVVIKDTVGLSSYSMEVAVSYKQAVSYLNSGRTKVDRLVEEYISGEQAGLEWYAAPDGTCHVLPPLFFSLNRYGITSPKQSVKLGGCLDTGAEEKYHLRELQAMIESMSRQLGFSGLVQCDLIHHDSPAAGGSHWSIIELNPRLSGMTETYGAALRLSGVELLLRTALALPLTETSLQTAPMPAVCNIKLPILEEAAFAELAAEKSVAYMYQIHNKAARQEREKGYCELVLCAPDGERLMEALEALVSRHGNWMEAAFIKKAQELYAQLHGQSESRRN